MPLTRPTPARRLRHGLLAGIAGMAVFGSSLSAEEVVICQVRDTDEADWWGGDTFTGDWFGLRAGLSEGGVDTFGSYTVDFFGNTTGGLKTGAVYAGLLQFGSEVDLESLVAWDGASLSTTWLWITGRDASAELVGNFLTISNVAGFETLRMSQLWFQQNLFDDLLSLRVGQLAADSEFFISDYASLFLNGTFGWPAFAYMNLPEGGPGYPMGTLGVRLAVQPVDWFTFLTAAFQGNVFAQDVNRHGFHYRLNATEGFTFLNEAQLRWNHTYREMGLPGQLKGGFWLQSGSLADPLADQTSSGNVGVYGIIDQMLYWEPGEAVSPELTGKGGAAKSIEAPVSTEKPDQGLGFFTRMAVTPADRNVVNFYFDAGLAYKGLIPTRDNDTLGVGFAYAQISNGARSQLASEGLRPVRAEMVLEATYQAQITNWFMVQPDVQFIINPNASRDLANAFLVGFRAEITF